MTLEQNKPKASNGPPFSMTGVVLGLALSACGGVSWLIITEFDKSTYAQNRLGELCADPKLRPGKIVIDGRIRPISRDVLQTVCAHDVSLREAFEVRLLLSRQR